ncbi:putative galactinol--sucrose galactosyltransferase 2 [Forsythia ovata]|uniref:Galactinol--sucrose galactosyltransferase 2 n=1 Tax=Forsythia ovata TaxID=205694 RepID=A0ABD1SNA1_9LAMI
MFNVPKTELSGSLSENRSSTATIALKVRRCGRFGMYCSRRPLKCTVGNAGTEFNYEAATGLMTLTIPVREEEMYKWPIEVQVYYDTALAYPVQSPGVLGIQPDIVKDSLAVHGLGLVHPKKSSISTKSFMLIWLHVELMESKSMCRTSSKLLVQHTFS